MKTLLSLLLLAFFFFSSVAWGQERFRRHVTPRIQPRTFRAQPRVNRRSPPVAYQRHYGRSNSATSRVNCRSRSNCATTWVSYYNPTVYSSPAVYVPSIYDRTGFYSNQIEQAPAVVVIRKPAGTYSPVIIAPPSDGPKPFYIESDKKEAIEEKDSGDYTHVEVRKTCERLTSVIIDNDSRSSNVRIEIICR